MLNLHANKQCLIILSLCVSQGAGEAVLHREQPQERAEGFPEWPDNVSQRK